MSIPSRLQRARSHLKHRVELHLGLPSYFKRRPVWKLRKEYANSNSKNEAHDTLANLCKITEPNTNCDFVITCDSRYESLFLCPQWPPITGTRLLCDYISTHHNTSNSRFFIAVSITESSKIVNMLLKQTTYHANVFSKTPGATSSLW